MDANRGVRMLAHHACRTTTDFGLVRREVMDLVKLMVPTLQQKLYSELNRKLVEVSGVAVRRVPYDT
jgi:hypothetical protein